MSKQEKVSSAGTSISNGFLRASERSYGGQPIFPFGIKTRRQKKIMGPNNIQFPEKNGLEVELEND